MQTYISMGLSVLIWSLYPLIAGIALTTMGSIELTLIVLIVASIGSLVIATLYLGARRSLSNVVALHKKLTPHAFAIITISGVSGVLCHAFLYFALNLSHNGAVALLYDAWPIIAVVAAPFLMKKIWKNVGLKEFIAALIALTGVGFIAFADNDISIDISSNMISTRIDYSAIGGLILAFAGGYMVAMVGVTQGVFAEYFKDLNDDLGATLIAQVWGRAISVVLGTILYIVFAEEQISTDIQWMPVLFIGIIVFVFGGASYTYALLKASTPTISVAYYFVPVLAVLWLWMAGMTEINIYLIIGGLIILCANIYLFVAGRKAKFSSDL